nr:hypothetical protein [Tanacetum cinerariifolium]
MKQPNPTFAKILILDTGKFKQWKFKIQQYLQNEHYALWEVIEFGDSYEASQVVADTGSASKGSTKKKGRTIAVTTEDMQKRRNDTFGGNKATKKTKKNQLKQQYRNFKAEKKRHWSKLSTDCRPLFWKNTGKKITIQGTDVAGFDKSKVECFNCHKMDHFARECRAPRSQDRGRRENFKQGSKVEESAPKALIAIDGVGWDWSCMANEEEDHALVADQEAPIEFTLMAQSSSDTEEAKGLKRTRRV